MDNLEFYLRKEAEKEKKALELEYRKKKKAILVKWHRKINELKKDLEAKLAQSKSKILTDAKERLQRNFYRQLNQKLAELILDFAKEVPNFIKNLGQEEKRLLVKGVVKNLKEKLSQKAEGTFISSQDFVSELKENFPKAKIEIQKDLVFGFIYEDDKLRIEVTPNQLANQCLKKFDFKSYDLLSSGSVCN